MKKRKKSLAGLKRELWKVFSLFVRQREADENGMTKCISCDYVGHWKDMDAGHFIPRSLGLSTYFEPRQVWQQCKTCNLSKEGNVYYYGLELKKRFGEGIVDELWTLQKQDKKYYPWEYEELIEHYKALVK